MKNPFTLTFGILPEKFIRREEIVSSVTAGFVEGENTSNTFILTGVRGSGKTVMLNYLKRYFAEMEDWIVVSINPEMDILEGIAAKLYEKGAMAKFFIKPSFDFSFHGLGFSLSGETPVKSIETLLEKMLQIIQKKGKKVLVAIDEISSSEYVRVFAHTFKNMVADELPVYLLATGLNENVYALQNEKTLTFLYRAPKIAVGSLNLNAIARSYRESLDIEEAFALHCAFLTEGYASAYQILGSLLYENKAKELTEGLLARYDEILEQINYEKLWEDLSAKEREFLFGFHAQKSNKAESIVKNSGFAQNCYSKYRDRLIKKGVVKPDAYGYLSFTLPRLFEFVERKKVFASFM